MPLSSISPMRDHWSEFEQSLAHKLSRKMGLFINVYCSNKGTKAMGALGQSGEDESIKLACIAICIEYYLFLRLRAVRELSREGKRMRVGC